MIDRHASLCRLSDLSPGMEADVVGFEIDAALRTRLMELGFCPDSRIRLIRRAPLGCPLEVEVAGSRFSVRSDLAEGVRVRHG